jgi:hypothetical protein
VEEEVRGFGEILYSLPKHHTGESEAVSTDGSGSQKYCTIRLYRSTVVIVAPYAARGWALSGIDINGLDRGECGARACLGDMKRLQEKSSKRRGRRRVEQEFEGSLNDPSGTRSFTREAYRERQPGCR